MNYTDWALDELNKAIQLEPDNPENYFNYAMALNKTQEFEKADEYFKKAIELDKNVSDYYSYYGENLLLERKNEEALEALKIAINLSPKNYKAKFTIAKIYFEDKKYTISKDLLLDIVDIPNPEISNLLAKCYMKLKEFKMAAGIFKKLSNEYPNNHILLCDLAKCQIKMEEFENAKENAKDRMRHKSS